MVTARRSLILRDFQSPGFTIVEFLVVFAITAVIIGFAIPALNNFNRTQLLKTAAAELKTNLRQAQSKAISGEKACNLSNDQSSEYLMGWYVAFDTTLLTYTIAHRCIMVTNGLPDPSIYSSKTYALKGVASLLIEPSDVSYLLFKPVTNGVSFYSDDPLFPANLLGSVDSVTLTLSNLDMNSYTVKINSSGEITDEKIIP